MSWNNVDWYSNTSTASTSNYTSYNVRWDTCNSDIKISYYNYDNSTSGSSYVDTNQYGIYPTTTPTFEGNYVQVVPEWAPMIPTPLSPPIHAPHEYVYIHEERPTTPDDHLPEGIVLTSRLMPIWEGMETDIDVIIKHLRDMLSNPEYRQVQLDYMNQINKLNGLEEVQFDREAIECKLQHCLDSLEKCGVTLEEFIHAKLHAKEQQRLADLAREKANVKAVAMLKSVLPEDEFNRFSNDKRVEVISKDGRVYELLSSGKINELLPNGMKQGLCINPNGRYVANDEMLLKYLLLKTNPEMLRQIANRVSPFQMVHN